LEKDLGLSIARDEKTDSNKQREEYAKNAEGWFDFHDSFVVRGVD
jgi:hypothetical protein